MVEKSGKILKIRKNTPGKFKKYLESGKILKRNPEKYSTSGKVLVRSKKRKKVLTYFWMKNPEKCSESGKMHQKNQEKYSGKSGKILKKIWKIRKNTPENLEKYVPKDRIPYTKSLFLTMVVTCEN